MFLPPPPPCDFFAAVIQNKAAKLDFFFQVVQHEYIEYMSVILLSNKYLWNPLCNTKDEQNGD